MGSMKIVQGGLKLSGRTLIMDRLVASAIRSRAGRPILIESTANITLSARNSQGRLVNSLKLSEFGAALANESIRTGRCNRHSCRSVRRHPKKIVSNKQISRWLDPVTWRFTVRVPKNRLQIDRFSHFATARVGSPTLERALYIGCHAQ